MLRSDLAAANNTVAAPPTVEPMPFRRLALFWICYAGITGLAGAIYLRVPPSPDQSIFDYMAWLQLHGVPFYKGSFDMTWPGQLIFHELGVWAFGVHPWTARATDFILLQPAVFAIYSFIRRCGYRRGALASALLYPIIYVTSGVWMTGLRDLTAAHFLIGSAIFAIPSKKKSTPRLFLSGALIGYATMIRPTYLAFAPLLFASALQELSRPRAANVIKQAGFFAAGVLTAPLMFAIYGLSTQTLRDWYFDSIQFVFHVYFASQPLVLVFGRLTTVLLRDLWWLTIAAILGAASWSLFGRGRQGFVLVLAMAATFVLSYFVQNKAFVYHLAGLIPVLVILGCGGVDAGLTRPLRDAPFPNALAASCAVLLVLGTTSRIVHALPNSSFWVRGAEEPTLNPTDTLAIANLVKTESAPDETFFQWGWNYQVSFLAERLSPSRLINTPGARAIRPGQPIFGEWLKQFDHELTNRPPKFILVDETVIVPGTFKFVPALRGTMLDVLERRIGKDYAIRDQRRNTTLLKLRP